MTPYVKVHELLASGPKSRQDVMSATGWGAKKSSEVLGELVERRDIRRIARGVYAIKSHPILAKKRID